MSGGVGGGGLTKIRWKCGVVSMISEYSPTSSQVQNKNPKA